MEQIWRGLKVQTKSEIREEQIQVGEDEGRGEYGEDAEELCSKQEQS